MLTTSISTSSSMNTLAEKKPESENQWSAILNEVRASATNRMVEKNLLVLGDRETGRSQLLAKLLGKDHIAPSGVGLEHVCVPVKDDEREDSTQLNAWILEEEEYAQNLLPLAFNEKNFDKTVVWLVVSMTKPWNMIQSLDKWMRILSAAIDQMKIDPVVLKHHRANVEKMFKEYVDPTTAKSIGVDKDSDLPLGENTLICNLGLPIIVVVTKADHTSVLEKEMDYREEKFDFLQMHLRTLCLKYGAALIFTSARDNKNIKHLLRYTAHILYGLKFDEEGLVLDRDSVFIPIGWDNEKKINILYDNLGDIQPTDPFAKIITAPPPLAKHGAADMGSQAEEDQEFLKRLQHALQQPVPSRVEGSPAQKQMRASPAQASPKKTDGPRGSLGAGGANESALTSFFNTLLNKNNKPGSPAAAAARTSSPSMAHVDAASELERLSKGRQTPPPTSQQQPENTNPDNQ
ncbi:cytoplasmic dynein 1 light intermediate chain 2-like [Paramacrobiotus metropolitanus]|uniref:cytoplasmic dynein 1 light intermediate chain 2-like n=1 Tax=Paramacrobiotus metropolitanus TaxID=2943436 RepID=UPI0024457386|nr:cytoplasmic dynein 1 light intermediate chain 2-like [Paramacrobiotus metropolitanus]